jgi:hypothetical protein
MLKVTSEVVRYGYRTHDIRVMCSTPWPLSYAAPAQAVEASICLEMRTSKTPLIDISYV